MGLDMGGNSVVEHLPSMHEVGGLTRRTILKWLGGLWQRKPQARHFLHALYACRQ